MVYVDTSVLAAYYCPEDLSDGAERALLRCDRPAISPLVEVELHSAVARKLREGALSKGDASAIIAQFRMHLDAGSYTRLQLASVHYDIARDWIGLFDSPLRTLDALHLALCFDSAAILLTADASLAKTARHFHIPTKFLQARR